MAKLVFSKDRNSTISYALFCVIFFLGMWMSKTLHPLYFKQQGTLFNFGVSYTCMAIAGYFSFYWGELVDRLGFRALIFVGSFLYGIGLLLRADAHSLVSAILSGACAGLGASMVLVSAKIWLLSWIETAHPAKGVSTSNALKAMGTGLGTLLAGAMPMVLLGWSADPMRLTLCIAAGLVFVAPFTVVSGKGKIKERIAQKAKPALSWKRFCDNRFLSSAVVVFSLISGFYSSFFTPYLPVIMENMGFTLLKIGTLLGMITMSRMVIDPLVGRLIDGSHRRRTAFLFIGEVGLALATGVLVFQMSAPAIVLALGLRTVAVSVSVISEETLWMTVFPKAEAGFLFGLAQTFFLAGDALGGVTSAWVYESFGLNALLISCSILIFANAFSLCTFMLWRDRSAVVTPACAI